MGRATQESRPDESILREGYQTTRQIHRAWLKKNGGERRSKEEQWRWEKQQQAEIRKELAERDAERKKQLDKERNAARGLRSRQKKKESEAAKVQERKKQGLPPVPPKEGQTTLASFLVTGKRKRDDIESDDELPAQALVKNKNPPHKQVQDDIESDDDWPLAAPVKRKPLRKRILDGIESEDEWPPKAVVKKRSPPHKRKRSQSPDKNRSGKDAAPERVGFDSDDYDDDLPSLTQLLALEFPDGLVKSTPQQNKTGVTSEKRLVNDRGPHKEHLNKSSQHNSPIVISSDDSSLDESSIISIAQGQPGEDLAISSGKTLSDEDFHWLSDELSWAENALASPRNAELLMTVTKPSSEVSEPLENLNSSHHSQVLPPPTSINMLSLSGVKSSRRRPVSSAAKAPTPSATVHKADSPRKFLSPTIATQDFEITSSDLREIDKIVISHNPQPAQSDTIVADVTVRDLELFIDSILSDDMID